VSLLIFGKKSEQFHALFCIGSQILFVNVLIDSIFSFSLFWFLRFPTTLAHTSFDPIVTFLYKTPPYFFNLSVNIIQNSITYDIILSWVLLWEERAWLLSLFHAPRLSWLLLVRDLTLKIHYQSIGSLFLDHPIPIRTHLSFGSTLSGLEVSSSCSNLVVLSISSSFGCPL